MHRREYNIEQISINRTAIRKVVIDPHYEDKHGDHISDELIIDLVKLLDRRIEVPELVDGEFSYFATMIEQKEKQYRLVWCLESDAFYVGVINAYRDDR